jgi:inner membrane protein
VDSITQFALGAAIGEHIAGKKAGNRAIFWGGIAGTIPDLDVLLNPFFTELEKLSVHRGFSHSLMFAFLVAPVMAWLIHRLYQRKTEMNYKDWLWLFFWGIFTHPLLDAFTLYGTQLFLPFSDFRVAFNTISIIDPMYTLPLLICSIGAMVLRRKNYTKAWNWNKAGLIFSSTYLLLTCANKWYLEGIFDRNLAEQGIQPTQCMSNPVIFSNLLWCSVVKDDSACYIGYYSILQKSNKVPYERFPIHHELASTVKDQAGFKKLEWFSKDYYVLENRNDTLCFYDVRYGKSTFDKPIDYEKSFVFYFKIADPEADQLSIEHYLSRKDMNMSRFFDQLGHRILHDE